MNKINTPKLNIAEEQILKRLETVLKSYMKEQGHVKYNDQLVNDLGLESIDIIDVVMSIEEEFSLEIEDDELDQFYIVSDIVKAIKNKSNEWNN